MKPEGTPLKRKPAFAVWITGLPASGKSTVTRALVEKLHARGVDVAVLESDVLRKVLTGDGGYDESGRETFYRSMVWIGELLVRHGVPVVFDATANRRAYRDRARERIARFLEVHIDSPLHVCMERDPKGIYRRGQEGPGGNVPGLQAPYEAPLDPEVRVVEGTTPGRAADLVLEKLIDKELIDVSSTGAPREAE